MRFKISLSIVMAFGLLPGPLFSSQQTTPALSPAIHWAPTEGAASNVHYVGRDGCSGCHAAQFKTQRATPMAHAAESAAECGILRTHRDLQFHYGRYDYRITREGNQSIYSVTDGTTRLSTPILWAFGMGAAGQTYIFEKGGAYYESKVSFFNDIQKLDLTLGSSREMPSSLEEALGNRQTPGDARLCVSCHTTGAVIEKTLHVDTMTLGVSCEACHGPGAEHVAAIGSGNLKTSKIFNPGKLATREVDEFCGSCHRTWLKVQLMHVQGVANVRFQPYRLENSRCWSSDDSRISCIACHNPHQPLQKNAAFYDAKCFGCHLQRGIKSDLNHPGKACPVGSRNCITCHMPRYELVGGHFKFIDHQIRVVRQGETYPN